MLIYPPPDFIILFIKDLNPTALGLVSLSTEEITISGRAEIGTLMNTLDYQGCVHFATIPIFKDVSKSPSPPLVALICFATLCYIINGVLKKSFSTSSGFRCPLSNDTFPTSKYCRSLVHNFMLLSVLSAYNKSDAIEVRRFWFTK